MPTLVLPKKVIKNNLELAAIFHKMADCYRYMGSAERFRALAYENVARVLHNMQEDIALYATDVKKLDEIGGIGESIAEKIMEFLDTGSIKNFEKLKNKVPFELLELMDTKGMGPATLRTLHEQLKIDNREELIDALSKSKLKGLKGFGEKKIEGLRRALKIVKPDQRLPLQEALEIGNSLLAGIKAITGVHKAELAGSLRRKKETIGDIDIVIATEPSYRKRIVDKFMKLQPIEKILARGLTKASVVLKYKQVQVDIRLVHDYEYGAALLYFTGSKEHNIKLRTLAKARGLKINEYGIFDALSGKRLAGATEEEMYECLHLRYIPPERRLDNGEIEKAALHDKVSN